jgi:hypothetical protein
METAIQPPNFLFKIHQKNGDNKNQVGYCELIYSSEMLLSPLIQTQNLNLNGVSSPIAEKANSWN